MKFHSLYDKDVGNLRVFISLELFISNNDSSSLIFKFSEFITNLADSFFIGLYQKPNATSLL